MVSELHWLNLLMEFELKTSSSPAVAAAAAVQPWKKGMAVAEVAHQLRLLDCSYSSTWSMLSYRAASGRPKLALWTRNLADPWWVR